MKFKLLVAAVLAFAMNTLASDVIPLAGNYEGSDKVDGTSRRMYVSLDFVNGVPDFTQQFTTKESTFKVLPKDFMNPKKLPKKFAGEKAPGFSRYREQTLFSNWENMKLTNPRNHNGIIICDWIEAFDGKTGRCAIIPLLNDSITIYGLSTLDPILSPNGLRLELVKSNMPNGSKKMPPVAATQSAITKIEEPFRTNCGQAIDELDRTPVTPVFKKEPKPEANNNNSSNPGSNSSSTSSKPNLFPDNFPQLWDKNGFSSLFKFFDRARGGDYGMFETISNLDFWEDNDAVAGAPIACRWFYNTTYENGRIYEDEIIFYGKTVGNKIVYTHSIKEGEPLQKLKTPVEMTSPDGKTLKFQNWIFKRTY